MPYVSHFQVNSSSICETNRKKYKAHYVVNGPKCLYIRKILRFLSKYIFGVHIHTHNKIDCLLFCASLESIFFSSFIYSFCSFYVITKHVLICFVTLILIRFLGALFRFFFYWVQYFWHLVLDVFFSYSYSSVINLLLECVFF